MHTEQTTRYSRSLPELRFSLNLLYVGRLLLGMAAQASVHDEHLEEIDERIEEVTDELVATELLHQAAVLAGDVLPNPFDRYDNNPDATGEW
ncbi:hypothetical protein GCM10023187_03750 [Nibrella viscosa]|uniref:Uncharacterized protein n=1 Tax=Nibrella viscosa TaxID=1084524 RepID=A0ABP8JUV1_9BACT